MKIVRIGKRRFRFKTSYNEFDLLEIKQWFCYINKLESLKNVFNNIKTQQDSILTLLEQGLDEQYQKEEIKLDSEENEVLFDMALVYIDMLDILCYGNCKAYLENSKGITRIQIQNTLKYLCESLEDFISYFNSVPAIEVFKHKPKGNLFSRKYIVPDFERITVMRDALASVQIQMSLQEKEQIGIGNWTNITKFIALIARPQKHDLSFDPDSFINLKDLEGKNWSDRAIYYQEKLLKQAEKNETLFENLSLPIAIGILKQYEKKKLKHQEDGRLYSSEKVKSN